MFNNSVHSLSPLTPSSSAENNPSPAVPMEINNVNTLPASMAVKPSEAMEVESVPVQEDVTPETFIAFMNKRNTTTPTPATFRNIKFPLYSHDSTKAYKGPIHFNGDKFIDAQFSFFNITGEKRVVFNNCRFETGIRKLNWQKVYLKNSNWQGTIIDGLFRGSRSRITSCDFSDVEMQNCTLRNFKIYDSDTRLIADANFQDSIMENMQFEGFRGQGVSYYKFEDTNFRNMKADKLAWYVVDCVKNVDLTNAKITKFSPTSGTKLTGVIWGDPQKLQITIDPAMFDTDDKIDTHLDSINNPETGALFLNTLDSITDDIVKQVFAEQLIDMIKNKPILSEAFAHSITLRQSITSHLAQSCYAASPKIQTFIRDEFLKEGNDMIIPVNVRPLMFRLLNSLEDSELLNHQFMVNQLIAEYPSLRQKFYQLTPIKEFIAHIIEEIMMPDEDSLYYIFYHPDKRKTALYLPAADYKDLLESNQAPQHYSFMQFQTVEQNIVTDKAATVKRQSRVLAGFPALHSLWTRAAGLLTPVIHFLFEHSDKLDLTQTAKAAEIKNHLILILKRQADKTVRLTDEKDACLLSEILAPFYIDGDEAGKLRWQLIDLIQQQLGMSRKKFSDREQKIIALMIIIRMLPDIFSTHYYSIENMSPYAPRQLAKKLIDDLVAYAPEIVDTIEATLWRNRLVTSNNNEFTCSAALATRMGNYHIPGERGQKMNQAIKLYYPLN
ncbi:hypothetical protein [Pantoea cypripedii]|nr:hypothetical protein [Pantoea cypripedii]MBP2199337.1 uncharacterized protein YjbI with pentapeptide repeats [Pantoea cypripedii]